MAESDYSSIVESFDQHVRKHFAYLEIEYGYTAGRTRTQDLSEPRDASVAIRYHTEDVSIEIGMSLVGSGIGVDFKNEHWLDIPKDRRTKWVSLDSVLAFRTSGAAKTLVHELTSSRRKYWPQGFLIKNIELAIQTLASRVKQHATDIIGGDVSSFQDIAACDRDTI